MKSTFKPQFELIEPSFGYSFFYRRYDAANPNPNEASWHYHPEMELVYVNAGAGKRQIGSHLSHYRNGDLILIGSNLPHCGFTRVLAAGQRETLIQWKLDAFGAPFFNIPEMKAVQRLFEQAKNGIIFHGDDKREIGAILESMADLSGAAKLLQLLQALTKMANSTNYTILNANGFLLEAKAEDQDKIKMIFNYVKENFNEEISLQEIAGLVFMTASSFCKYFKKITSKTFVQFLNEYRLIHAAKLLHESRLGIGDICYECGFNNYSHFTKKFKEMMGKTPLQYRNELRYTLTTTLDPEDAVENYPE
jgi:AraC-like DNA-binding protein